MLSTIDLQSGQAVVTRKVNREETYSVIEWNGKGPEIRTSVDDEEFGLVLATAGLYEIEELIAEIHEDDPLLDDLPAVEDNPKQSDPVPAKEDEEKEAESDDHIPLLILLEVSNKNGLTATPMWRKDAKEIIPVYGKTALPEIERADRPALMRFVAEAGERGFVFDKAKGVFSMKDWKKVALIAEDALPRWDKAFRLEFSGDAHLLREGQRVLSWEIEARSRDSSSMTLRENFRLGSLRLGVEHSRKITKARNGATFIRGHGLVRLDQDQLDDFEWWQRNRGDSKRANWPRYMLFPSLPENTFEQDKTESLLLGSHRFEILKPTESPRGSLFSDLIKGKASLIYMHCINSAVMGCLPMRWDWGKPFKPSP